MESSNGYTGLNPGRARANILNFNNQAKSACKNLSNTFMDFSGELKQLWSSPKAVEFSRAFSSSAKELSDSITSSVNAIDAGACSAYNAMASAHGAGGISVSDQVTMDTSYADLTERDSDGIVGMDIERVQALLDTFENRMRSSANEFNSLPTSIALYDDENGQQRAYSSKIKEFGSKVEELSSTITNRIKSEMETEVDKAKQGKSSAVSSLQG